MFQELINGSLAVLTRPSLSTFEEHERDNLVWATVYVAIAAAITGLLSAVGALIRGPFIAGQLQQLEEQLAQIERSAGELGGLGDLLTGIVQGSVNPLTTMITSVFSTLVGFYIALIVIFLIGLALGGNGRFGHLAYDLALFNAPLSVINAVISLGAIGPLSFLTSLVSLGLWVYSLVLTYFGIRAGMNLTHGKTLFIVLLPIILFFLVFACSCAFIIMVAAGAAGNR